MRHSVLILRRSLLLLLMLMPGLAFAQSGQDVLDRIKARYASIDALQASFRQTVASTFDEEGDTFEGTLLLQGDRYRVETGDQTIVTDGVVTYIWNASENQLLINDYVEDETTFSLNDFLFHFDEVYEIASTGEALLGGKPHHLLRLRPKDPEAYFREITLLMNDADSLITRLEVTDVNDTKLVFQLRDITLNPPLAPDTFTFTPPEGAEVVDLRTE